MIRVEDLEPPSSLSDFEDVYIISELMETDLHRIIYSRQELSDDHIQYFIYQVRVWLTPNVVRCVHGTPNLLPLDLMCAQVLAFRQRHPP